MTTQLTSRLKSEAIVEINQLLRLLESRLPANIRSENNQRLAKRFQNSLAEYFKGLADAFPYYQLDRIYQLNVQEVSLPKAPPVPGNWEWLDPLLWTFKSDLLYRVNSHLGMIYVSGSAEMISWGKTKIRGLPIYYEGPPMRQAVEWAEKYGSKLVTKMDEETKARLAKIISDGIENKRGIAGLARDIRKEFEDMSRYRSELISHTETGNALGQAFLDRGRDMDIDGKEWVLGSGGREGNCQDCIDNADEGVIPFNQAFSGGVMTVLQHPGCTCACAPASLPKEKS